MRKSLEFIEVRHTSQQKSSEGDWEWLDLMPESTILTHSLAYRYRLPVTIFFLLLGWMGALFSRPLVPEHTPLDHGLDLIAWFLLFSGLGIRAWASREISGRKKVTIVKTGPYALCRNPLYWGTFLIAVSQLFFLRSLTFALGIIVPVEFYILGVVPAEERFLQETLGTDYLDYCHATPRWWPKWNSAAWILSPLQSRRAFHRELSSLACWFLLPGIAELICYLRELPRWPHIFGL